MSETFNPAARSVLISVTVVGPRRSSALTCAIDTGSTQTILPTWYLRRLGYDLSRSMGRTRLRSATGIAAAPLVSVSAITGLERVRTDFAVAAHDLPPGIEADGILGLNFFRGWVLTLDFARGRVSLSSPKRWWQLWR